MYAKSTACKALGKCVPLHTRANSHRLFPLDIPSSPEQKTRCLSAARPRSLSLTLSL